MKRGKVKRLKNKSQQSEQNAWYWFNIWQDVNSFLIEELNKLELLDEVKVTEDASEDMINSIKLLLNNYKK